MAGECGAVIVRNREVVFTGYGWTKEVACESDFDLPGRRVDWLIFMRNAADNGIFDAHRIHLPPKETNEGKNAADFAKEKPPAI
jgi:hypothetical protein